MDWGLIADFDFALIWRYLPSLLRGIGNNIVLTVAAFLFGGVALGTLFAILTMSSLTVVRWTVVGFTEFWRSTPLLVQAIWMHFAFPIMSGLQTTPFQSALIALTLNVSAYCSEIIRAGILSVPIGQFEAARALGMRPTSIWYKVVLPQAIKTVIPPLTGTIISIFKATAILSVLAINDIMRAAQRISSYTFKPIEVYTAAAVLAFVVGYLITRFGRAMEYKMSRGED